MKLKFYLLGSFLVAIMGQQSNAQSAADYAIQLQATVQTAPPKITLNWRKIPGATQYILQRKTKAALAWSTLATTVDTFHVDATIVSDSAFEYKVINTGGASAAAGYIYAGINTPALHNKGTLILVVDSLFRDSCAIEMGRLMQDLNGDGWTIVRHNVPRNMPDTMVKKLIKNNFATLPDVKAVLIIGHVAVPYSGNLNPDAHPDHLGAWPADVFYGEMDGAWTDAVVNNTVAARTQNDNIPGDGKWDQSTLPSTAELQVSRIDFASMPTFGKSEVTLMKSYLAKAHQYKMDSLYVSRKAIIDDNFGAFSGEAFAANGWRNFSQIIGRNNIIASDFVTSLNDSAYQWAYGCGGGSYNSCGGVGVTADFTTKKQKGIFTLLFGSYFGDWDSQNNFLRAPLCSDEPALTSCWAGRPNWFLHHVGLGENIGYSTLLTQNYAAVLYAPGGYMATGVHVALMGDLSLRNEYIKPARNLVLTTAAKKGASLSWTASPDPSVLGYYVYRSSSLYGKYNKISGMIVGTNFKDTVGVNGLHYYMIRPTKLQQTPSGTYYNLGLGITDSIIVSFPDPVSIVSISSPLISMLCFPNPTGEILNIYSNTHTNGNKITISIVDITGKVMLQKEYETTQSESTISENLSLFASGVYFVAMRLNGKLEASQKIIKR